MKPVFDDPFDDIDPELEGDHLNTTPPSNSDPNRETWLLNAIDQLVRLLEQVGAKHLRGTNRLVSVGLPKGNIRKVVGECHYAHANNGVTHIFVSPTVVDPIRVLVIVLHELIHEEDKGKSGHRGAFRVMHNAVGLTGKTTASVAGDDLTVTLKSIADDLGPYPHSKLNLAPMFPGKQTTRLLKVACPDCEYTIRTTAKWVTKGLPTCPCGTEMAV